MRMLLLFDDNKIKMARNPGGPVIIKDMQTPRPQKWPSSHKRCAMCKKKLWE